MKEEKKHKMKQHSGGFLELWTVSGFPWESKECCYIAKFAFDNTLDATNKVQWHNQPGWILTD